MGITQVLPDNDYIAVKMPASTAIARGDLLCMVANVAQKASSRSDLASLILNQADFASIFLGVMRDVRLVGEAGATDERVVVLDGVFDMTCASATWEIGDLIGIDRDAGNSVNYNQQVIKVVSKDLAIGVCMKRGTSITTVRGRLQSKVGLSAAGVLAKGHNLGTPGASTAAAGSTTADATVLPAGTAAVYPTTAADDTKGVRIHLSDLVTGRTLFIGNGVSNKILKVYAPSGGVINGAAADAAFSSVSGKGVIITCLSSSGNTWLAW